MLALIVLSVSGIFPAKAEADDDGPPLRYLAPALLAADDHGPPMKLLPPADSEALRPPLAPEPELPDYIIGPGDQLTVTDYSVAEKEAPTVTKVTVLPDGRISIYPIGIVRAAGLSLPTLNKMVSEKAAQYFVHPDILINVSRTRPVSVYVLGDVIKPGLYTIDPSLFTTPGAGTEVLVKGAESQEQSDDSAPIQQNIPKVTNLTLITSLQLAQGLRDTADVRNIRVNRRQTGETFKVDLWKLFEDGDSQQDLSLQSGDTVFVPKGGLARRAEILGLAGDQRRHVRIWGAIHKPGLYELSPDDDLYSVIARAGGFTDTAITSHVLLSRLNPDGSVSTVNVPTPGHRLPIPFTPGFLPRSEVTGRLPVRSGDVVIVSDSTIKHSAPKVTTLAATMIGAATLLYLSRNVKDHSGGAVVQTRPNF